MSDLRAALHADDIEWWTERLAARNGSDRGMAEFVVARLNHALASEPPVTGLDGERLARAIARLRGWYHPPGSPAAYAVNAAREIAAEYDREDSDPHLALEGFDWPTGPASGVGSGIWAAHRDRIIAAALRRSDREGPT